MNQSTDARLMLALQRGSIPLAWGCLAGVLYLTWGPTAAVPKLGLMKHSQFAAYLVGCTVFVIAYPSRWRSIALSAALLILGLELLPYPLPRHAPRLLGLICKPVAAAAGVLFTRFLVFSATSPDPRV